MSLEFTNSPEGYLNRSQTRSRSRETLQKTAHDYSAQAEALLKSKDGEAVRDDIARFAKPLTQAREGLEEADVADKLLHAISMRRPGLLSEIPDDQRERRAFALAVARAHMRAVQ